MENKFSFLILTISLIFISSSLSADCSFQIGKQDYCGPEASKLRSLLVPDHIVGPFNSACMNHDYCYYQVGNSIVRKWVNEGRFSSKEIEQKKKDYDRVFLNNMLTACDGLKRIDPRRKSCKRNAKIYFVAVLKFANKAMSRAIGDAEQCILRRR